MKTRTDRCYQFDDFQLDPIERVLLHRSVVVHLTPKSFDVLRLLVEKHGHLVEKETLLNSVWPDAEVEEANIAKIVSGLRKLLSERSPGQEFIETVPTKGYRFVAPLREREVVDPVEIVAEGKRYLQARESEESDEDPVRKKLAISSLYRGQYFPLIVSALIFVSIFSGLYFLTDLAGGPAEPRNEFLLADIEDLSGSGIYPTAMRQGLAMEFQRSTMMRFISDHELFETISELGGNPRHRIGRELALQICKRKNLRAYIVGTISKYGGRYVVGLEAIDVRNDRVLVSLKEEAGSEEMLPNTFSRLAARTSEELTRKGFLGPDQE